jgi:hypothetical protein
MENTIVTTFLIIVSVILVVVAFNAVYPAAISSADAVRSAQNRLSSRLKTDITIIHVTSELDRFGAWQDVNGDGEFSVFIWIKNTGDLRIAALEACDLFLGPEGAFERIAHESQALGDQPYWAHHVENGAHWDPTRTLKITVSYPNPLSSDRYDIRFALPNGVAQQDYVGF